MTTEQEIWEKHKIRQVGKMGKWWLSLTKKIKAEEFDTDFDKLMDYFNAEMGQAIHEAYEAGLDARFEPHKFKHHEHPEAALKEADDVILDLVNQFQYGEDPKKPYSGGLSALEGAFRYLISRGLATGDTLTIKLKKVD